MAEKVIELEDVHKNFRIYLDSKATLKEKILRFGQPRFKEFVALKNVTLSLGRGESLGLIGPNGSGKSTLLKLISRILYPDTGQVSVHGRVSSLLELGAGFHPEFTGEENIFMNASLLGLTRKEIEERKDQIVDFSGLQEFISQPVRSYSSGMYMRLAFSVATAIDPDILLIDEVLAVGDAEFQTKCFARLADLRSKGKTIVIVSHDLSSIERYCDRAVWLEHGEVRGDGAPRGIVDDYMLSTFSQLESEETQTDSEVSESVEPSTARESDKRWGNGNVVITEVLPVYSGALKVAISGRPFSIIVRYRFADHYSGGEPLMFGMHVRDHADRSVYGTNTAIDGIEVKSVPSIGEVKFVFDKLELLEGTYYFDASVYSASGIAFDHWLYCAHFFVRSPYREVGEVRLVHHWELPGQ